MNIVVINVNNKNSLQEKIKNEIKSILENNQNAKIYTILLKQGKYNPKTSYVCYYDKKSDLCLWEIKNINR